MKTKTKNQKKLSDKDCISILKELDVRMDQLNFLTSGGLSKSMLEAAEKDLFEINELRGRFALWIKNTR